MGAKTRDRNGKLIDSFDFPPGKILARKYEVVSKLGGGWEGEVYIVLERATKIERTAKLFFPHRNLRNRAALYYAKTLHKLRDCPIVIKYHTQEEIIHRGIPVTCLVSEYVEGEILTEFLNRQPGKRIHIFQGLHLLHTLAAGLESIHQQGVYHGDLHAENVIVRRHGLGFDLKLVDLFHWEGAKKTGMADDLCDIIRIFYEAVGGQKHYHKHPAEVKSICCGLKRTLILNRFKTAAKLRSYLEAMTWG